MANQAVAWRVEYPDVPASKAFQQSFRELHWEQFFSTTNGICRHTFGGSGLTDSGGNSLMTDMRSAVDQLKELAEFKFRIVEQTEAGTASEVQHHCIINSVFTNSTATPPRLVIWTRPRLIAKMQKDAKNRAHNSKSGVHTVVSSIVSDYGAKAVVQDCATVPEFQKLRQINLTDWGFILSAVIPRSATVSGTAGFEFYSIDGTDAHFSNLEHISTAYNLISTSTIIHQTLKDPWGVLQLGGGGLTITGMSDDRKQRIVQKASGGPPTDITGKRTEYCPYQTTTAIRTAVAVRHWQLISKFGQHVIRQIGDVKLAHPAKVKDQGLEIGIITGILHTVKAAAYEQHLTMQTLSPIPPPHN